MKLFDSHAHYIDRRFEREYPGGAAALLENEVLPKEIGYILNVGTNPENARRAVQMAEQNDALYAAVGIHPEDGQLMQESLEDALLEIESLLGDAETRRARKIVALGEIGLDYHDGSSFGFIPDPARQKVLFESQMELARRLSIPVLIHDREAHGDCFETVLRYPEVRGVFHSYSGSAEMARELIRRGWYVSFSGVVTFKNAARVREVVRSIPLDALLIETDAPYLAPHPFRGKLNHSGLMHYTAEAIAEARGIEKEAVVLATTENAKRLFGIEG